MGKPPAAEGDAPGAGPPSPPRHTHCVNSVHNSAGGEGMREGEARVKGGPNLMRAMFGG